MAFINKELEGLTIKQVRNLSQEESGGHHGASAVLMLSNGMQLLAYSDDEGNGFGTMVVFDPRKDSTSTVYVGGGA